MRRKSARSSSARIRARRQRSAGSSIVVLTVSAFLGLRMARLYTGLRVPVKLEAPAHPRRDVGVDPPARVPDHPLGELHHERQFGPPPEPVARDAEALRRLVDGD